MQENVCWHFQKIGRLVNIHWFEFSKDYDGDHYALSPLQSGWKLIALVLNTWYFLQIFQKAGYSIDTIYDIQLCFNHKCHDSHWVFHSNEIDTFHKKWNAIIHRIYRAAIECNSASIGSLLWASCQICKIVGCACARNARNVSFVIDFKWNRKLAIPACITTRAWRTCPDACRDR